MPSTLENVLSGAQQHNIAPFLWVHGETEEAYRAEIAAIQACGIDQLCIEARPHDDFAGPGWYRDLGIILDECRKRGMGAWLLDDSHFPTGYANGEVERNHPELRKRYLSCKVFDVMGPLAGAELNLKFTTMDAADKVLAVLAQPRLGDGSPDATRTMDLTALVHGRADYNTGKPADMFGHKLGYDWGDCPVVGLDLPEGPWFVFVLVTGFAGGEKETEGYLNPLEAEATQVLVSTVYQPMWDHFSDDFGTTFLGFFSDEPRFGNIHGSEGSSIGRNPQMPLPWREDLRELLAERLEGTALAGRDVTSLLPLLFYGETDEAHVARCAYMDLVSQLYSDNFDGVLSGWCKEHGVRKIGHTIEDNNAVARLGYGPGHFFRSMAHSSMAGVDVVLNQLMPGYDSGWYHAMHKPGWDMEFFTYMLGKLGGSLAHLDASKGGRCMAEVFGAYGWGTGNRLCKWLVDYMLVRGVNFLVPHAFDPMEFPDPDCPAHFYAQGKNPQYGNFGQLMGYANRLCSLLSGGRYDAPVALWFNAEAEWSGAWQLAQEPAAAMGRAQVEYDLVSSDYLDQAFVGEDGRAVVGAERFRSVVVPWGEAMPAATLKALVRLADGGVPVFFIHALPERSCEGTDVSGLLASLAAHESVSVVGTDHLVAALVAAGLRELAPSTPQRWLRTYHYQTSDGMDAYLLVNEHPSQRVTCTLGGAPAGSAYVYDAFENRLWADDDAFSLDLPPYGSKLVLVSAEPLSGALLSPAPRAVAGERVELGACTLALAGFEDRCAAWGEPTPLDAPVPVSSLPGLESFAGLICYAFDLELTEAQAQAALDRGATLALAGVAEGASVTVNAISCGTRIVPDHAFAVGPALRAGTNHVVVELDTTLGRPMDDFIGQFLPIEPTGMSGATLTIG